MISIDPQQRVDWWRVIDDLNKAGLGFRGIAQQTQIPLATLAGYKNLNVEPKHADGERLLALWRRTCTPAIPTTAGSVRNRERSAG